jgi:hypothetical protein
MDKHVDMFEPALQSTGDGLEGLSQHSRKVPHRAIGRATALDGAHLLNPVTRENVRDWPSVVVTRNGPEHLWGTEWKLSRECRDNVGAWFWRAQTMRWRDLEHVLLFEWLSGIQAEPLGSAALMETKH